MEEKVILSVRTYDNLKDELYRARAQVEELQKKLNSIKVFELSERWNGEHDLILAEDGHEYLNKLKAQYTDLEFEDVSSYIKFSFAKQVPEKEEVANKNT